MSPLVERLAELRLQLAHLRALRPRIVGAEELRGDLSLRNDVLAPVEEFARIVAELLARGSL